MGLGKTIYEFFVEEDIDLSETSDVKKNEIPLKNSPKRISSEESKKILEIEYADWWTRFKAYFIDNLIFLGIGIAILFCLWIVYIILGSPQAIHSSTENSGIFETVGAIGFIVIYMLYFAYFESSPSQATPGKKYIGEFVCDISGKRISFGKAFFRSFVRFFMVLFPLPYLTIPFTLVLIHFTKKNQGLHDLVAGTIVLKGFTNN